MRRTPLALLVCLLAFSGCRRSDQQQLTPEQAQEIQAAREATISSCERVLGRPLTESEKACIHDDIQGGQLTGYISSPLSDLLQQKSADFLKQHPPSAPDTSGMQKYQYLATDGSPHMLLPAEVASAWSAVTSAAVLDPNSDYGRACAAIKTARMAIIPVGAGSALILATPAMSAWGHSSDQLIEIYDLESWSSPNLDALIDRATAALPTSQLKDTGNTLLLTQPDAFLLSAGDTPTNSAYGVTRVPIAPGKYHILTGTYSAEGNSVMIYRFRPG